MKQIERIKHKLLLLQQQNTDYRLEAHFHRYTLNPRLSEAHIRDFERQYAVTLPTDYRAFLTMIGNGRAGPYYGLRPLEETIRVECFAHNPLYLAEPYPLVEGIELFQTCAETDSYDEYVRRCEVDNEYMQRVGACVEKFFAPRYSNGALDICDYGCGIAFLLIATGTEAGSVWVDDRVNEAGMFPLSQRPEHGERVSFLAWYENWLDASLYAVAHQQDTPCDGYFEYGYPLTQAQS